MKLEIQFLMCHPNIFSGPPLATPMQKFWKHPCLADVRVAYQAAQLTLLSSKYFQEKDEESLKIVQWAAMEGLLKFWGAESPKKHLKALQVLFKEVRQHVKV